MAEVEDSSVSESCQSDRAIVHGSRGSGNLDEDANQQEAQHGGSAEVELDEEEKKEADDEGQPEVMVNENQQEGREEA